MGNRVFQNGIFIISLILLNSCKYASIPGYIKDEFNYSPAKDTASNGIMFDGIYTDIKPKTATNRKVECYKIYYLPYSKRVSEDTLALFDIVFFKNGLCTMGRLNDLRWSHTERPEKLIEYRKQYEGGAGYWGYYKISGDTLIIKSLQRNSLNTSITYAFEQHYIIIDKLTLQPIYFRSITKGMCNDNLNSSFTIDTIQYPKTKFYPMGEKIIDQNECWLLEKKWFWKNVNEYVEWKRVHGK